MKSFAKTFTALVCAAVCTACSQQAIDQQLDDYFDALDGHFMGSIVVQQDGKTVYQRSLGWADVENQIPATAETQYRIGSISKTFTAVLVLKAAADGRLSLNDPIAKYFPDAQIPNAEHITIDQLLQHRSGLVDIVNDKPYEYLTYYTTPQTRQQILERVAAAGTNFEPGSEYRYCNTGYNLLGYILEDVWGKPFAEIVSEQIVNPLDLRHTRYSEAINPQRGDARSYTLLDGWQVQPETDASVAIGAGALASTPADLAKFGAALVGDIFGNNIFEQMKEVKDAYGRGLVQFPYGDQIGYGHAGLIDGFGSKLVVFDNVTVAFCSNGADYDANLIVPTVLDILNGKKIDLPKFDKYIKLSPEQLASYTGVYRCDALSMEVTVRVAGDRLSAQASGQSSFPLDAVSADQFENATVGAVITVAPDRKKIILKQMGQEFEFARVGDAAAEVEQKPAVLLTNEQLATFVGVYNCSQLKMDLKFTIDGDHLVGQATGQSAFPLQAANDSTFENRAAGIKLTFDLKNNRVILNQSGMQFDFLKKDDK
ncbi:MAG: serine hydrolase [Salinivirgaceae bacterium]|nr:serine hydrolase [Salinivirgaceae bacterium]